MKTTRIERRRGDTYPIPITVKKNKAGIDITGYSLKLTASTDDTGDVLSKAFDVVGVIDDVSTGKAHFPMAPADVDRVGTLYFDIQVTDNSGYIHTPVAGTMEFKNDYTK